MFSITELFNLRFHYGHKWCRSNPKMKNYIFCQRWGISIIDLCKTSVLFENALNVLYACARSNGKILFVGTKHQAKDLIAQNAVECGQYYVNHRWLGGTITNNFSTIVLPLNKLKKLEKDQETGFIDKYTKKERTMFQKEKERLEKLLNGIRNMDGIPDMLVVVDPKSSHTAIREANLMNIPVLALADTDTPEPKLIKHIVPGNDESKSTIGFFLTKCREAIAQGMQDCNAEKAVKAKERLEKDSSGEVKSEGTMKDLVGNREIKLNQVEKTVESVIEKSVSEIESAEIQNNPEAV